MGLGTKIKETLSGEKGNHGSQRRNPPPGAYPDSTVDVPRKATTDTWNTTQTTSMKPASAQKDDRIAENDEFNDYTYTPRTEDPIGGAHGQNEGDLAPSPDSRFAGNHNRTFSKDNNKQHPYWGNVGESDTRAPGANRQDMTSPSNNDNLTFDAGHGATGDNLGRQGTVNSTNHQILRSDVAARGYDDQKFEIPSGNFNRGQPRPVDNEAARDINMAASQGSQPTDFGGDQENAGLGYGKAGYGTNHNAGVNQYDDTYGVQRTPTNNGKGAVTNARGNFGSPPHDSGEQSLGSQPRNPGQTWPQNDTGAGVPAYGNPADERYSENYPTTGFGTRDFNSNTYQAGPKFGEQPNREREQVSPEVSSENGSGGAAKSAGEKLYGPGHSGAKVLHRCQHCGNDNDITRYFSNDVVYRLS